MSDDINNTSTGAAESPSAPASNLEAELKESRELAESHYRSWQRSAADFANFKRRIDEEKRFAERWLLQDLLPVVDDFDRAWVSLPLELRKLSWIEGLLQVHSRLFSVLQRHGVSPIETADKDFNPLEHEAVMRAEDADPLEQTAVVAELQRGYKLHDRVLRAALVKVGRPPADGTRTEVPAATTEVPTSEGAT
jgi:molecular chaperone GrpE